jgi:hypothetical protein
MSIIHDIPPETSTPVLVMLSPGALERAERTLAEAEELLRGSFLQDPQAPAVFGRLKTHLSILLGSVTAVAR